MSKNNFGLVLLLSIAFVSCNTAQKGTAIKEEPTAENRTFLSLTGDTLQKVVKSAEEWKSELGEDEYLVLREAGTERAFTGKYWDNKKKGTYTCKACKLPLFESGTKFVSGTGWPSFYEPLREDHVKEITDKSYGMVRVEAVCARCGGHLGHVFDDGPKPSGLRYCMNSLSLGFEEKKK